jgi:hypothetical protein
MPRRYSTALAVASLLALPILLRALPSAPRTLADEKKDVVLKAADISPKIFPETVFFRGQSAPVQMRNTGGVHFTDDLYVLAGMVDNSGYSSGIRQKYQAYLLTEVPLQLGGQPVKPGAYGFGFLENNKFVLLDLGANELFQISSTRDAGLKRPTPFQVMAAAEPGKYRLYMGREFIEFNRAK